MTPITLNTFAVATKTPSGFPQIVTECHNRATAEFLRTAAHRKYIATFGTAKSPYIIAAPGEAALPSR